MDYVYAVRGDGQPPARPVPAAVQRRGLEEVLATLSPDELDLPDRVLELLLPRPFGYPQNRELFAGQASPTFDSLGAAGTAARLTVQELLQPERAARMVDLHRRDSAMPGFEEVLAALTDQAFSEWSGEERSAAIRRVVQGVVAEELVALSGSQQAPRQVRARAEWALEQILSFLQRKTGESTAEQAG